MCLDRRPSYFQDVEDNAVTTRPVQMDDAERWVDSHGETLKSHLDLRQSVSEIQQSVQRSLGPSVGGSRLGQHQELGSVTFDPAPAASGEPTIRADNQGKEIAMGMRRRARRRGMIAGAVAGGAIAHHRANRDQQDDEYQEQTQYAPPPATSTDELEHLAQLHSSGALSDDEFAAAKAKVLGT
jgi:hypothetical protein